MRKLLALIMAVIIVIGTLTPVVFSLNSERSSIHVSQQRAFAVEPGTTVVWGTPTVTAVSSTSVKVSASVTYNNTGKTSTDTISDGDMDVWYHVDRLSPNQSTDIIKERYGNVANATYNTTKTLTVTLNNLEQNGEYEFYFKEDNVEDSNGDDIESPKIKFKTADPNAAVVTQSPNNGQGDIVQSSGGFQCTGFSPVCWVIQLIVALVNGVPNFIASIVGMLSDFFLHLAIQSKTYGLNYGDGAGSIIYSAWKIIRDFANIGFIFALFVAAFMLILDKTSVGGTQFDPKKVVVKVVVMALLVNFSLFFCRMIIQTADVFSHVLYNKITTETINSLGDGNNVTSPSSWMAAAGIKSPSLAVITQANPQALFTKAGVTQDTDGGYTAYLVIAFIGFFIYLILIYLFVSMLFIWIGRIFGSWIAMILSPLAFVSWAIPFIEDDKNIGFTNWLQNFVKLAFLVPIYLFFVYITAMVLKLPDLASSIPDGSGWLASLVSIIMKTMVPLLGAVFILMKGKSIAYDMSGEIGKMAGKISGMATTVALGAATGGAALLGRQTLGRIGAGIGSSEGLMNAQAQGGLKGWGAGMLRGAGKATGAATFDVRNNKAMMGGFTKATGAAGGKIDLGSKGLQKEGGFTKEGGVEKMPGQYADYLSKQAEERKKKKADELSTDLKAVQDKKQQELQKQKDQAQTNLDNEKNKIDFEAENQSVDSLIEQERLNLAGTNQAIADIDRKIAASGFNQADLDKAQTDKTAIDTLVNDIDERIKANNAMLTSGTAAQQMDAQNKKAALDQEKQNALKKQQDADQELAKQQSRKTDHDQLVSEKATKEKKAENISNKVNMLSKYEGKTIRQMKNQMEIDKMKAETEIEGKELKEAKEAEKKHTDKLKELGAKLKKAKDEGDLAEVDALNEKIEKERVDLAAQKKITKDKEDIYNKKYNFKVLEDSVKDAQKDYVTSQKNRLDPLKTLIQEFDVKIKEMNNIHADQQHDLMNTLSQNYENANQRGNAISGISRIAGVFSVGRAGGSNFQEGRANNNAANYARNRARGRQ